MSRAEAISKRFGAVLRPAEGMQARTGYCKDPHRHLCEVASNPQLLPND